MTCLHYCILHQDSVSLWHHCRLWVWDKGAIWYLWWRTNDLDKGNINTIKRSLIQFMQKCFCRKFVFVFYLLYASTYVLYGNVLPDKSEYSLKYFNCLNDMAYIKHWLRYVLHVTFMFDRWHHSQQLSNKNVTKRTPTVGTFCNMKKINKQSFNNPQPQDHCQWVLNNPSYFIIKLHSMKKQQQQQYNISHYIHSFCCSQV